MRIGQCTLGAGATPLTTQISPKYAATLIVQNNAAHNVRLGDNTVSATKGILLLSGSGSATVALSISRALLSEYYLYGTSGDMIDFLYEEI